MVGGAGGCTNTPRGNVAPVVEKKKTHNQAFPGIGELKTKINNPIHSNGLLSGGPQEEANNAQREKKWRLCQRGLPKELSQRERKGKKQCDIQWGKAVARHKNFKASQTKLNRHISLSS